MKKSEKNLVRTARGEMSEWDNMWSLESLASIFFSAVSQSSVGHVNWSTKCNTLSSSAVQFIDLPTHARLFVSEGASHAGRRPEISRFL